MWLDLGKHVPNHLKDLLVASLSQWAVATTGIEGVEVCAYRNFGVCLALPHSKNDLSLV